MNFGDFGYVTTFQIFTHIKTDIKHGNQFNDKLAVACFISKIILCDRKQQKEPLSYFDWKPYFI